MLSIDKIAPLPAPAIAVRLEESIFRWQAMTSSWSPSGWVWLVGEIINYYYYYWYFLLILALNNFPLHGAISRILALSWHRYPSWRDVPSVISFKVIVTACFGDGYFQSTSSLVISLIASGHWEGLKRSYRNAVTEVEEGEEDVVSMVDQDDGDTVK